MTKIVRLPVTEEQHRALRILAAERMMTMQQLIGLAVLESPVTKQALAAKPTGTK